MEKPFKSFHARLVKSLIPMYVGCKAYAKNKIIDAMGKHSLPFADLYVNHLNDVTTCVTLDMGDVKDSIEIKWCQSTNGMWKIAKLS